jgi:hypothetical protein
MMPITSSSEAFRDMALSKSLLSLVSAYDIVEVKRIAVEATDEISVLLDNNSAEGLNSPSLGIDCNASVSFRVRMSSIRANELDGLILLMYATILSG